MSTRDRAAEVDVAALRDERNHWIGEAKRYERLYRSESESSSRWFRRMKAAEAAVARVEALADEWDATIYKLPAGYPMTVNEFCRQWFKFPLRATLGADQ